MINEIRILPEETEEQKAAKELMKHFNEEAFLKDSRYSIEIRYAYPHLLKKQFVIFQKSLSQICYYGSGKVFSFVDGIDQKDFKEIKDILGKIPEKFEVDLKPNGNQD